MRSAIALPLAVVAIFSAGAISRSTATAGPVPNSIQQVYNAGSLTSDSTAITDYTGELLTLQGVYTGFTASEPTIGVDPDGVAFFASSILDVDRPQAWGVAQTKTVRSLDGGVTWQLVQNRVPVADVSIIPGNLDPMVWVDPTTGRVFNLDLYGACSYLNYSDDKGATWSMAPAACGIPVNDHQTIGGGVPRAHTTTGGYPNALYYCGNHVIQAACGRSLDGGVVWTPTASVPYSNVVGGQDCDTSLHGHVATDPAGRVLLPRGACDRPWIAVSEDDGDSWTRAQLTDAVDVTVRHTSVAADAAGNLYYVYVGRVAGSSSPRQLPWLQISRDHGATWSQPMMIAPPGVNHVNFPVVTAGDEGRIAINFPGTLNALQTARAPWNQYVVVSVDALSANPTFLSATGNDPVENPVHRGTCLGRCGGMWDFIDVKFGPDGAVWAAASDDCTTTCNPANGAVTQAHVGDGLVIKQIGGPRLRAN